MSELRNVHTTSVHIDTNITNIFFDETRDTLLKIKEDYELQLTLLLNAKHSPSYDPRSHKLLQNLAEYSRIAARPPGSYSSYTINGVRFFPRYEQKKRNVN